MSIHLTILKAAIALRRSAHPTSERFTPTASPEALCALPPVLLRPGEDLRRHAILQDSEGAGEKPPMQR
eukprot:10677882-Alexandrium_andersonii.AAC.1